MQTNNHIYLAIGQGDIKERGELKSFYNKKNIFFYYQSVFKKYQLTHKEKTTFPKNISNKIQRYKDSYDSGLHEMNTWIETLHFGEKSESNKEIRDLFKSLGIYHLLIVSGLHINFLGVFVLNTFISFSLILYSKNNFF